MRNAGIYSGYGRRQTRAERRIVCCPNCGWRLCDTLASGKMETGEVQDGMLPLWTPDYIIKCGRCKKEIGIHKEMLKTGLFLR